MNTNQTIQFLRSVNIYDSKSLAIEALNTVVSHKMGQPVMVRYNDGVSENPKIILAIGIVDGIGVDNYRLVANAHDLSIVANYAQTTNANLITHTSNDDIHVTSLDKAKWNGYAATIDEILTSIDIIDGEILDLNTNISTVDTKVGDLNSLTTTNKTNVVSAVNEVKSGIDSIVKTSYKGVKSGDGVNVSEIVNGEQTISVKVNSNDKVLGVTTGGLEATVGLTYSNGVIKLTGKSGAELGSANIGLTSIVKDAKYDATTEEIVINFNTVDGKTETVKIPVGSLIDEWDVKDSNNITLNKVRNIEGKDVLTADVLIDNQSKNALTTSVNGLYVKDYTDDIKSVNDKITNQLADIAENGVNINLSNPEAPEKLVSLKSLDGQVETLKTLVGDIPVATLISNLVGDASEEYNTLGKIEDIVKTIQNTSSSAIQNVVAGNNITVTKNGTSVTVNADTITEDVSSTTKSLSAKQVVDEINKIGAAVNGGLTMDGSKKLSVNVDSTSVVLNGNKLQVSMVDGGMF